MTNLSEFLVKLNYPIQKKKKKPNEQQIGKRIQTKQQRMKKKK